MTTSSGAPRVGIDGFNLALSRGTGVATYARVLSHCLTKLGHPVDVLYGLPISARASATMREVAFFDTLGEDRPRRPPKAFTLRWAAEVARMARGVDALPVPITGKVVAEAFRDKLPSFNRLLNVADLFPAATRHFRRTGRFLRVRIPDPPRIMHWTYPLPIRVDGATNVYTMHDLVPLRLPYTTLDNKGQYYRLIRGCLRQGDHVCTVSEASLRDILEMFPEAAGRVTNTYEAIDLPPTALAMADDDVAARLNGVFGLQHRGYFLFFGSIEPKKNVGRLVEAYLASGVRTPLVIVGAQAWKSEGELRWARSPHNGGPGIIQFEYVPFALLLILIRGAKAVTFPSLYEGFGLPVLEAMALGTPALTATTGSLPEIAGDAAVLVDPYDTGSIAAGLRRIDADAALLQRLGTAGPAQAEKFSMAAYRDRVSALYGRLLATRG